MSSVDCRALEIPEIKVLSVKQHDDPRGFFSETYSKRALAELGITLEFVQDNHSLSRQRGTIRGLHYQIPPYAQDKLVRVIAGRVLNVAVDIRRSSPTFGRWVSAEISARAWNQILVPIGFAHGFCSLEPDTEVLYKVTNYYAPQHEFGIRWNDPELAIDWTINDEPMVLSDKDRVLPLFKNLKRCF